MDLAAYISLLIVLSYLLVRSADLVEDAFVLVAGKLGVSTFTIGFLILSLASSLPEISLMITSTLNGAPGFILRKYTWWYHYLINTCGSHRCLQI
jgi:Ca2+/Na+ antiporter